MKKRDFIVFHVVCPSCFHSFYVYAYDRTAAVRFARRFVGITNYLRGCDITLSDVFSAFDSGELIVNLLT